MADGKAHPTVTLSLSVRIAEGFLSKEVPTMPMTEVASVAAAAGYNAVCMRASQIGIHTPAKEVAAARDLLDGSGLGVSMVTGDFDIVYNNDHGPNALRNIRPYIDLAVRLGAPMVRVALKKHDDINAAQEAADVAADHGIRLVHQCHTLSLFETVDGIEATLNEIDRANFGLIFEPANLELCGQDYGPETIARLRPRIFNVYVQNQHLKRDGAVTLDTWCRGPVSFDIIPIHQAGGIDFAAVMDGLKQAGYAGPVTVHQSAPEGEDPLVSASTTATFLRQLLS